MNHYLIIIIFVISSFYTINIYAIETEDIDDDDLQSIQIIKGQAVIFVEIESQQTSGLKTLKLQQVDYQAEYLAYGKTLSIVPILKIREQYLSATAVKAGAKARLIQAEKNISRLRDLHKNKVVSTRKLQRQQSQWQSDKATYNTSTYQHQIIVNNSQLQWGETLTEWVTNNHSVQFDKLIAGELKLLQLTLPASHKLPVNTHRIFINPTANRSTAFEASFMSESPQVDSFSQGSQYFFVTKNPAIKVGMNFTAWIPQENQKQRGVIIPKSSLAWHLGQAFIFIKTDEQHFVHRNINNPIKVANGYFISEQIKNDEEVVITGTQMLLSHEFRSQIPDEDDD